LWGHLVSGATRDAPDLAWELAMSTETEGETPAAAANLAKTPPDRLSTTPGSKFYDEAVLARGVGVRFKGVEKTNVEEYCVSEGWVRLVAGVAKDRNGNPMTVKVQGTVEPYFRDLAPGTA
jgi:hypothetical protein